MKALLLGLALLAAVTGFSLLPSEQEAARPAGPTPYVVPGPVVPAPEWSIQPIPTDGWQDGPTALPTPPPVAPPHHH